MAFFTVANMALNRCVYDTSSSIRRACISAPTFNCATLPLSTTGSVELGLSAITRFVGPIVPALNTYDVPVGPTGVAGKTGSRVCVSVNLNADGNGHQQPLSRHFHQTHFE